jgi:hypothetical protein
MKADETLAQRLYRLENHLLKPDVRRSSADVAALLADDFVEFGSGGRVYDRKAILEELATESPIQFSITDFRLLQLTPDIALVTYRATATMDGREGVSHSLRSSIWKRLDGSWRMIFHQGTPAD